MRHPWDGPSGRLTWWVDRPRCFAERSEHRLQRTVADLKAQDVTALTVYSEGVFDDVDKATLAGLASGQHETADEILAAYARRYFGVDADTARLWAAWLKPWGKLNVSLGAEP